MATFESSGQRGEGGLVIFSGGFAKWQRKGVQNVRIPKIEIGHSKKKGGEKE
jgi:hypothetical protein